MTSTSDTTVRGFPNVPAPPGSKAGGTYSRIIPREELKNFEAWQPGALAEGSTAVERRARPRPEGAGQPDPEEWRSRIAEARKAGYQDGYRDGLVGLESFKQAHAAQGAAQVGQLLSSLDAQWTQLEPLMAQALARSAVALARRVLRQEVSTRPELVVALAQEAVQAVMLSARRIELHVHPDDLELVTHGLGDLLRQRGARLKADVSVQRGGCRVDSDIGMVDATLAARWARAAAALGSELPLQEAANAQTDAPILAHGGEEPA